MIQTLFGSLKEAEEPKKRGLFDRMREAVTRTRENLSQSLEEIVALTVEIDDKALDELEMSLIAADLGVVTAQEILGALRERALTHKIRDGAELKQMLRTEIKAILDAYATPPRVVEQPPEVILLVGVNGTGKTTTSGKLAAWYRAHGPAPCCCARQIPFAPRRSSSLKSGDSAPASRSSRRSRAAIPRPCSYDATQRRQSARDAMCCWSIPPAACTPRPT